MWVYSFAQLIVDSLTQKLFLSVLYKKKFCNLHVLDDDTTFNLDKACGIIMDSKKAPRDMRTPNFLRLLTRLFNDYFEVKAKLDPLGSFKQQNSALWQQPPTIICVNSPERNENEINFPSQNVSHESSHVNHESKFRNISTSTIKVLSRELIATMKWKQSLSSTPKKISKQFSNSRKSVENTCGWRYSIGGNLQHSITWCRKWFFIKLQRSLFWIDI